MCEVLCPKCHETVEACGELNVDGQMLGVYQCGRCLVPWDFDGERFEVALTFALDADGVALDPADLRPLA